ncbi:NADPH-dependent FMN reductase [Gordoniibacillus kamchatkensis]|uniref:NADPH-dependent FMN reductase n=1 Tax=Gordoniibacillus kamchatkensis TaxID=1590651 RepID=A0ABR5ADQ0_9BACL|nr:NAD(P)H-dependent oxidoreductase [Paenibacillus sp. VKM B-2647]KIL39165.1 NADPH-dependent FMN reductase [Paenibacillus sp. VKM B-2647]
MKIVAIVGSIRKDSLNRKLAEHVKNRYQDKFEMEILTLNELPMYNQDIENDPPEAVRTFKNKVKEADAVLWVTPEYNATIPGVLANAIDWLSRVDKVMIGKPSWIMGASMGQLGTVKAQAVLRTVLFAMGLSSPLLPGNEVYVGAAHEKFDASGRLIHEPTITFLDGVVDNFIAWYRKYHG